MCHLLFGGSSLVLSPLYCISHSYVRSHYGRPFKAVVGGLCVVSPGDETTLVTMRMDHDPLTTSFAEAITLFTREQLSL